jgi:hypothetical protein
VPISAETLRKLMDAGLEGEALLDVVAAIDADHGVTGKARSAGAIRQERYRERKASQTVTGDVTSDASRDGEDFLLSPKEVSPAPLQEITPFLPTTHKENPPKGGQKKASRLPSDWMLPVEWRQDARDAGLAEYAIDLEAEKIRDWSRSSKNGAKLDWRAAWRNWCRGAAPNQRGSPPPGKPRSVLDAINALNTRMEQADAISSEAIEGTGATVFRLSAAQQR